MCLYFIHSAQLLADSVLFVVNTSLVLHVAAAVYCGNVWLFVSVQ